MVQPHVLFKSLLIVGLLALPLSAQVNIAKPGESGFGGTVAGAFSSDANALGVQFTGTMKGYVDLGVSITRETPEGNADGYWVKGISATLLPLRSRQEDIRWNLGGTIGYSFADVTVPVYSYYPYGAGIGSYTRSVEVLSLGGILLIDIDISPKTWLQLVTAVTYQEVANSNNHLTNYTMGLGFVTQGDNGPRIYFLPTYSIPSEGTYTTVGVEIGLFWGMREKRRF